MTQIEFSTGGYIMGAHDAAIVLEDEDPRTALIEAAVQSVSTDVEITVGGVTLFLAAWMDPVHWSEEWSEKLGVDYDEVDEAVAGLISGAMVQR